MSSEEMTALEEMGVHNADQIIGYTLVAIDPETDVIRINYKRPRGSFLPRRRIYEFKRMGHPKKGRTPGDESPIRFEISPLLRRAVDELDALLADQSSKKVSKEAIRAEIQELRAEIDTRLAHIDNLLDALAKG